MARAIESLFQVSRVDSEIAVTKGELPEAAAKERQRILTILENMASNAANAAFDAVTPEWLNNRAGAHDSLQAAIKII